MVRAAAAGRGDGSNGDGDDAEFHNRSCSLTGA
jgi:hypothetical protein